MKRKGKKKRIGLKIVCCLLAAVLIAALAMFGRLGLTILGVKCDPENGVYVIDYREDYKLQQLLDEEKDKNQTLEMKPADPAQGAARKDRLRRALSGLLHVHCRNPRGRLDHGAKSR